MQIICKIYAKYMQNIFRQYADYMQTMQYICNIYATYMQYMRVIYICKISIIRGDMIIVLYPYNVHYIRIIVSEGLSTRGPP